MSVGVDRHRDRRDRQFENKKQAVSYAGLDPRVRQSGEKERTDAISKEGPPVLRWALGQGALNVVKYDSYLGNFYTRLKDCKNNQKALAATAWKLLVSCYAMLTKKEAYNPPGATLS